MTRGARVSERAAEASAPTRIDLAGGTLDIWPLSVLVPSALTVNLAIDLRAWALVTPRRDRSVVIRSEDRRAVVRRRLPLRRSDAAGPLSFLQRIVAAFDPAEGLELACRAEAPAGAGLGGSSALGIAAALALSRFVGERMDRGSLLRRVMNAETAEIGVPTGNQDYLAALHGGLSAFAHTWDGTVRRPIAVPAGLAGRLVLAYTGQPRESGFSNWDMFRRFVEGERVTTRRLLDIARIASDLAAALGEGDLDAAGRLLGEEGRLRYRLAPTVATPSLLAAGRAARRAGALGVKACGAGGGGCLVAFAGAGRADAVARAMAATGARLLPFSVARRGASVSAPRPGS